MKIKIYYVSGCEGNHIEIGDYRVCGPKAWGGGQILKEWTANTEDILHAVNYEIEKQKKQISEGKE